MLSEPQVLKGSRAYKSVSIPFKRDMLSEHLKIPKEGGATMMVSIPFKRDMLSEL